MTIAVGNICMTSPSICPCCWTFPAGSAWGVAIATTPAKKWPSISFSSPDLLSSERPTVQDHDGFGVARRQTTQQKPKDRLVNTITWPPRGASRQIWQLQRHRQAHNAGPTQMTYVTGGRRPMSKTMAAKIKNNKNNKESNCVVISAKPHKPTNPTLNP